ncbi:Arginase, catabolizes arginine to ornithine and urea [Apophysomyces sp. BC1034]|nr:Arginase, catabolizes arginine to ornithine and urea [Apophysomyces sp. BC1015]KAG0182278.1 Arginase, catabolizes arginine to ornithine and urea [Apophysomyces sp. BC1021]KAG0192897.1 Arginase, catabolizes arginine to ornithine and urea [Apophysomyces sp. BC1034]
MTQVNKFLTSKTVAIVGVPFNGGQPRGGVEEGPLRLVEFGLANQLEELGWKVEHEANENITELRPASDPDVLKLKQPKYVSAVTQVISKQIYERASQRKFVLTLGGDHSAGLATVSGVFGAYPDACLIWVDAHADINTPATTDSGNIHGCPLSFLTGIAGDHPDFLWVKPLLKANRLAYIGLRDIDDAEKKIIKDLNITAFSMHHVDKYGIGKVVEMTLDSVNPNRDLPIHLSFDVDALDPSVAPSTGTPVRGGLTFREGHYICEALAETGLLVAADIMEVNPALEDDRAVFQTVQVGCSLARCCLGEVLL